jgi:hypothetical protein
MQTFLPYPDFEKSAQCLDNKRLGKQRVETMQILNCLLVKKTRWYNHPAVQMWKNYELPLWLYAMRICDEWISRGYKDTCKNKIFDLLFLAWDKSKNEWPRWLEDEKFHRSHQSNLIRKLPNHYRKYFPDVPDDLLYYWPTKHI